MVNFCALFGCSNRCNREKDKSFFRIPKILLHGDEEMRALSIERRREWVSMINQKDTGLTASHHRVCSDHFVSGTISHNL